MLTASSVPSVPLTVLEEFLLLALDDRSGALYPMADDVLHAAMACAVMMDLALHRRLDTDLRSIFVVDNSPIGDDILDPVLQMMGAAPVLMPRPTDIWIDQLAEEGEALHDRAVDRLIARGILAREDSRLVWARGERRYPGGIGNHFGEVKLRILEVILADDIPMPHDIMLTALADACGLFRYMLNSAELSQAGLRIARVARLDLIGQAVARLLAARSVDEEESAMAAVSAFG